MAGSAIFGWFPDYSIKVDQPLSKDNVAALLGSGQGTYSMNGRLSPQNHWEIPAGSKWRPTDTSN
jgi:hypothetical protein